MWTDDEWVALSDNSLNFMAHKVYSYLNRYVDHRTGLASASTSQLIDFVTFEPKPGSREKRVIPTRQNIRTALEQLQNVGLVEVKIKGERNRQTPVYLLPFTWVRKAKTHQPNSNPTQSPVNAGFNDGLEHRGATQHQPNTNPKEQPNTNPTQSHVNAGFNVNLKTDEQPNKTPEEQPLYSTTLKDNISNNAREKILNPDVETTIEVNFKPPNLDNIIQFFLSTGGSEDHANDFYDHYESVNWTRPGSGRIAQWQPLARKWIRDKAMNQLKQPNQQSGKPYYEKPKSKQHKIFDFAQQQAERIARHEK